MTKPLRLNGLTTQSSSRTGAFFIFGGYQTKADRWEDFTTTELCSGFQGLGGGAYQQAIALCQTSALLASIIPKSDRR